MSTTFEELLARDGYLVYKTRGVSMEPMLVENRDLVIIRVPTSCLKKYDVALYKRGDSYVLHRVIAVRDGHYLIRGDNTYSTEHVPDTAVIGVLTSFRRKGIEHKVEDLGYLCYVRIWQVIYPLRLLHIRLRPWAIRIARRMGFLPLVKRLLGRGSEA